MTRTECHSRLLELANRQRLADSSWLVDLTEHDEPPIFDHASALDVLLDLPYPERLSVLLEVAIAQLDAVAASINRLDSAERYFLALTLIDWSDSEPAELHRITPAVLVSPHWRREIVDPIGGSPVSPFAMLVDRYIREIPRSDLIVREGVADLQQDVPPRICVGYRDGPNLFRSVGSRLR